MSLSWRLRYWLRRGPNRLRYRASGTRWQKWLGVGLLPLVLSWGAAQTQTTGQAQSTESTAVPTAAPLPTVSPDATRAELLDLLNQVQTQLQELGAQSEPGQKTDAQLTELRSQLEVLLLQAQLERLQRENSTLAEQLQSRTSSSLKDAGALEGQITQLKARQDNMNQQMEVIAHQHAEILEYSDLGKGESQTHKVQVGDSLSKLALEYYDDAMRWTEILKANPKITDPNILMPGTELTIPAKQDEASN